MITKMMGLRAASGAFIITALCVGNLYHEGKLIPQSKIEEEIDMQKRLANVYFMAKKRKMEAESGEEIQIQDKNKMKWDLVMFYTHINKIIY